MEESLAALMSGRVPSDWLATAGPSMLPLSPWLDNLKRVRKEGEGEGGGDRAPAGPALRAMHAACWHTDRHECAQHGLLKPSSRAWPGNGMQAAR